MPFASIEEAAADMRDGRMIIIVDDEDRENEGDLVCAAELVTPEVVNFMATHARGLICMPLTEERCDELHLTMQVADNTSFLGTAFTVSIEARKGVTTGISASDRATTILTAVDPKTRPQDLARPGHIFPLRAKKGGVLVRPGQTEASVDLARIAGLTPAAVICEIMNEDGTMARMPQLEEFAARHELKIITVADLVRYRMQKEILVRRAVETDLPTVYGTFRAIAFENVLSEEVHLAMVMGEVRTDEPGARPRPHRERDVRHVRLARGRHGVPAPRRAGAHRGRGARRRAVSAPAAEQPRPRPPAPHLPAHEHGRAVEGGGEPPDRVRLRPRLRRRRADTPRAGPAPDTAAHEPPAARLRARRLRAGDRRQRPARDAGREERNELGAAGRNRMVVCSTHARYPRFY